MTAAAVLLPLLGAALAGVVFAFLGPIAETLLAPPARTARAERRTARRVRAAQARADLTRRAGR